MIKSNAWYNQIVQEADRPTITLMIGVPGSGKSTWIRTINAYRQQNDRVAFTIISTDDILEVMAAETGITYAEAWQTRFKDAEKLMKENFKAALDRGDHIIVDRTNMSKKVRNKILSQVPKTYLKFAALFQCEREELDRRLAERCERTGKFIPVDAVNMLLSIYESPTTDEFDEIFV